MKHGIKHDKDNQRFIYEENGVTAFVDYVVRDDVYYLTHSEVPHQFRGQGIGKKLVEDTFEFLEQNGLKAVAVCSYIKLIAQRSDKWRTIIG